jgi:hypothetical protein
VTTEELYLFDLTGYLILEDVLSADELGELNSLIDGYDLWRAKGSGRFHEVWNYGDSFFITGPLHTWDAPFRALIDHQRIVPYLNELIGPDVRYDIGQAIIMRAGEQYLELHGGGTPYDPGQYYHYADGRSHNGLLVVSYALSTADPGEGGFAAIPGSHKANYGAPGELRHFKGDWPCLEEVSIRAGSAVIFTEALTHGTLPWRGTIERRQLTYKYAPGHVAWAREYPRVTDVAEGEWHELAASMLEPPWVGPASEPMRHRPVIEHMREASES